jgi:1-acyl-sn-glycerol-3-phosphate acyltransferase
VKTAESLGGFGRIPYSSQLVGQGKLSRSFLEGAALSLSQIAAIAFLVVLLAVPVVAAVILVVRSRLSPFQCFLWGVSYLLCKFLWRARWLDELPLPQGQGAIVVINHRSSVDPFFVQTATLRKVHWLVAREYCEHWAFRWFLTTCEVIPVSRGGIDTAATKRAIRMTAAGDIIGMLPEGRINMTEEFMLPARPGTALVALKAKVPVLPCYLEGSPYRWHAWTPFFMRAKVTVRFGQPIDLSEFYDREKEPGVVQEAMHRILKAMAELAGQPDFEPKIAGRNWRPTDEELIEAREAADRRRAAGGERSE